MKAYARIAGALAVAALLPWAGSAQGQAGPPQGPPPQGPGRGGPGGGVQGDRPIVAQFDKNGDKRLNADERREARTWIEANPTGRGRGRTGGTPKEPGVKLSPGEVKTYKAEPFYAPDVLRTLFLEFENGDWEKELTAFNNTDVEVPATLTVDGRQYKDVGVHSRGMSSFFGVPEGSKRSLNVAVDWTHENQAVQGYRTLNLLNSHVDPSFLRTVLYLQIAREYVPAPKANFVRVVLNQENWGVYVNAQQYNKDFVNEWFKTTDGARWKVPGSPGGRGGLEYLGEDPAAYKRVYEIKTKDDPKSWAALAKLTKTLNETPAEQLEKALAPMLNVDGVLKWLALDVTLVNNDGYWTRASDYSIYLDPKGVFHIFPHDANETLPGRGGRGVGPGGPPPPPPPPPGMAGRPGGPPMQPPPGGVRIGGPGGGGPTLDPLVGLNDATKPLRSKLLAVPALRARYMTYVRDIANKWLDWNRLGPIVARYQALIDADVKRDTRKLDTYEGFLAGTESLKQFADQRREFIRNYKEQ